MSHILAELEELKKREEVIHTNPFIVNPQALIFLIAGISGVGKSTIVRAIVKTTILGKTIKFVITHTTRKERYNEQTGIEINGVHYFFISVEEFLRLKDRGYFAEWEELFGKDCFYGTSFNQLYEAASNYGYGITDIDVLGAKALKDLFPNNIHTIFVAPQSEKQAVAQLELRAKQEAVSELEVSKRMERFKLEMSHAKDFDSIVTSVAGCPEHALECVRQIINDKIKNRLE